MAYLSLNIMILFIICGLAISGYSQQIQYLQPTYKWAYAQSYAWVLVPKELLQQNDWLSSYEQELQRYNLNNANANAQNLLKNHQTLNSNVNDNQVYSFDRTYQNLQNSPQSNYHQPANVVVSDPQRNTYQNKQQTVTVDQNRAGLSITQPPKVNDHTQQSIPQNTYTIQREPLTEAQIEQIIRRVILEVNQEKDRYGNNLNRQTVEHQVSNSQPYPTNNQPINHQFVPTRNQPSFQPNPVQQNSQPDNQPNIKPAVQPAFQKQPYEPVIERYNYPIEQQSNKQFNRDLGTVTASQPIVSCYPNCYTAGQPAAIAYANSMVGLPLNRYGKIDPTLLTNSIAYTSI